MFMNWQVFYNKKNWFFQLKDQNSKMIWDPSLLNKDTDFTVFINWKVYWESDIDYVREKAKEDKVLLRPINGFK